MKIFLHEDRIISQHISLHIISTSHCCPHFAAVDVLGLGKNLRNMAHMSNMFSHHVGTKGWSQYCKRTQRLVVITWCLFQSSKSMTCQWKEVFDGVGLKQLTHLDLKHNIGQDYIIGGNSKNYNTSTSPNARVYKRVNQDPLPLDETTTHFVNLELHEGGAVTY